MIEKPSAGRSIISQNFQCLTIEIPAKKNWFAIVFISIWMLGWLAGEVFVFVAVFTSDQPLLANAFLLFWLIGWTVGGVMAFLMLAWQLGGKEIISLENNLLKIEKSIEGIGRKKFYDIHTIKNLSIQPTQDLGFWGKSYSINMPNIKNGKIKFDYGMKTIKFADEIDEAEARMIMNKLKERAELISENFAAE